MKKIGGVKISSSGKRVVSSSGGESSSQKKIKKNANQKVNEDCVKVNLWNFNEREELLNSMVKLKRHWEKRNLTKFKYQFNCVDSIDGSIEVEGIIGDCLFTNPYDVKISHTHQAIIVLDNILERLLIFDVNSLEFCSCVETEREGDSLALELEYCESRTDALYIAYGSYGKLIKYDLEKLCAPDANIRECQVWVQDNFDSPYSTAVSYGSKSFNEKYHFSENTLYVCDRESDCIAILEASTGEPLTMIEFSFNGILQSVDFLNDRHLVVSLFDKILILEKDRRRDWRCIKSFDNTECLYLTCDRDSNKILCSTALGLLIIDVERSVKEIKVLGSKPNSLALDGPYLYYTLVDKKIDIYE